MFIRFTRIALATACASLLALSLCACSKSDSPESGDSSTSTAASEAGSFYELLPLLAGADATAVEADPEGFLTDSGYSHSIDVDQGIIGITPDNFALTGSMKLIAGSTETSDLVVVRRQVDAGFSVPSYSRTSLWASAAQDEAELLDAVLAVCNLIGGNEVIATYSYTADGQCYALAFASCQVSGEDCLLSVSAMQLENNAEGCGILASFVPLGSSSCPETSYDEVIATMDSRYGSHA